MSSEDEDQVEHVVSELKGARKQKHVVIIGAGAGGTCLAARLAHKGHKVTVVEKHDQVGGRCSLLERQGYRWDVGPSLYLMPEVFEQAFASVGRRREDFVTLKLASPSYTMHYHDGKSLQLSSDLIKMGEMLEEYERPAGNPDPMGSFMGFIQEAGVHYEESIKHVLTKDWSSLSALLTPSLYPMLLKSRVLHIYTSLYSRASSYFYSDHIRRAFTFSSMYMGMSPMDAPATYSLLQYAEYAKGVWYPIGGFQRVVSSFQDIAEEDGATFRFNESVKRIVTTPEGKASGVLLESGEEINADVVVSNADLVWTYNNLLPPSKYARRLQKLDQTCSSISFYWGLNTVVPELSGHNIFLAEKYKESFDEIFREGLLPSEPSFYVNVPSRLDPTASPAGKDTLVILVPCGPLPLPGDESSLRPATREAFAETRKRARKQIIDTLNARLGRNDFESLIAVEEVMEPTDWAERFSLFRGSILGLSHTIPQVLWFRPTPQHAKIRNLFFAGASTQPGTGVPVVIAGSGVVAEKIDRYLSRREGSDQGISPVTLVSFTVLLLVIAVIAAQKAN